METSQWLTIQEYSTKHKVSISTLRRKIKGKALEYSFKDGRYLLRDKAISEIFENSNSLKDLQQFYQELLKEKEDQILKFNTQLTNQETLIKTLQENTEDLQQLVHLLEQKDSSMML